MAVSDRPFFSEEQQSRSLTPRAGLWVAKEDDCSFDITLPVDRWPDCADGVGFIEVRDGSIIMRGADEDDDEIYRLLPVDGNPPLVQVLIKDGEPRETYAFVALDRVEWDAEGRAIAVSLWLVACGTEEPGSEQAQPKIRPFPGLDADCRPASVEALRAAALASRPSGPEIARFRWVRDEAR